MMYYTAFKSALAIRSRYLKVHTTKFPSISFVALNYNHVVGHGTLTRNKHFKIDQRDEGRKYTEYLMIDRRYSNLTTHRYFGNTS